MATRAVYGCCQLSRHGRKPDIESGILVHPRKMAASITSKIGHICYSSFCKTSKSKELLNDQVFEVCKPAGSGEPSLEIVFFHGLQLERSSPSHVTTWLSGDKSELWLNWLRDDIPDIRVLIVSYDASSKKTEEEGRTDMFITCENLVQDLTDSAAHVGQDGCPVILVGHCLGGLVMKEVCVKANLILALKDPKQLYSHRLESVQNFLENVKGFFFYATPHHGGIILSTLSASSSSGFQEGSLMKYLAPLNDEAQRRNEEFRQLREKWNWKAAGVGEGRVPTDNSTGCVLHVPEASSRSGIDVMWYYTVTTANHFNICQPSDKKSPSFKQLLKFIEQILEEYQRSVAPPLSMPNDIVGMHKVMEEVEERLKSTNLLAIIGMGGIGKTTLAKCLYEHIKGGFRYACLIEDVKGRLEYQKNQKNVFDLQELIIKGLTVKGKRRVDVGFDWKRLENTKILIVLDDVEILKRNHVRMMKGKGGFSKESRIIVTCRNKMFLESEGFRFYEMGLLADPDSYRLLCLHAFRKEEAPNGFQGHVREVLKKCGNLPLALEVVGSSLFGREIVHWTEMTETIAGAHSVDGSYPDELWSVLRRSFDSLDSREQAMFLDIATCFHGEMISEVKMAWRFMSWRSAESGWQNLVDRCLAKEDSLKNPYANIFMHELLRDLGKSIARPSEGGNSPMHTRVHDIQLANRLSDTDKSRVQVLKLRRRGWPKVDEYLDMRKLHGFHDLRALWLDEGGRCDSLPELLANDPIFPVQLTYIQIANTGSKAMHGICQIHGLRCLILKWGVVELPPSVGHLVHLEHLEIEDCEITAIPGEIAQLRSLNYLKITNCGELTSIPTEIGELRSLHHFHIEQCRSLRSLPSSIIQLEALQIFKVDLCGSLWVSFSWLCKLRTLKISKMEVNCHIEGCYDLRVTDSGRQWVCIVSSAEARLIKLEEWLSTNSTSDVRIHVHLWDYGQETCFFAGGFENVRGSLSECQRFRVDSLVIYDIHGDIEGLFTLSAADFYELQTLEIINCRQVAKLPPFGPQLSTLRHLHIHDLPLLETIPELWQLKGLQVLELRNLPLLETLPISVGHLQVLKSLRVSELFKLSGLPETIGNLQALIVLELVDLPRLDRLPESLGQLTALRDLKIDQCVCLRSPWGTACNWSLGSLETLTLDCCCLDDEDSDGESDEGSQFPDASTVDTFKAECCEDISYFPKRQRRSRMVAVEVLDAVAVREKFHRLKSVALTLTMGDVELFDDFGWSLSPLERLEIRGPSGLTKLPETCGQLGSLKVLKIVGCDALIELPKSVGKLSALERLEIIECPALLTLPEPCGELGSLKFLKIEECDALVEVSEWVGQLPALEHLRIASCEKLTTLKGSVGQVRPLDRLHFTGDVNENLAQIVHSMLAVGGWQMKRLTIEHESSWSIDRELSALFRQLPGVDLEHLDLRDCKLISLPQSVGQICGLRCLTFECCKKLEELPESIGQLGLLRRVVIKECTRLTNLSRSVAWLAALEDLDVDRTILVKLAGHLGQLGSLKRLSVEFLEDDRGELPDSLGQLGALEELAIRGQDKKLESWEDEKWRSYQESSLRKLPESIGQLSALKHLEISYCKEIAQLPTSVGELPQLAKIVVRHCPKLEAWRPSSQHLRHVQKLELTYEDPDQFLPRFNDRFMYSDEHGTGDEVLTTILQRQDLLPTAERRRSLLEAAERLRDRVLEEAGLS